MIFSINKHYELFSNILFEIRSLYLLLKRKHFSNDVKSNGRENMSWLIKVYEQRDIYLRNCSMTQYFSRSSVDGRAMARM